MLSDKTIRHIMETCFMANYSLLVLNSLGALKPLIQSLQKQTCTELRVLASKKTKNSVKKEALQLIFN